MKYLDVTSHINAGGRGTRLASALPELNHPELGIAKAGLIVGEEKRPIIDYHIERQLELGFTSIVAAVGDQAEIANHIRSRYISHEKITAFEGSNEIETGGNLLTALRDRPNLYENTVLISNVDTLINIDVAELVDVHRNSKADLTIALTRLQGVPNQDAFLVDANGLVIYSAESSSNVISLDRATNRAIWRGSSTGVIVASKDFLKNLKWTDADGPLSIYSHIIGCALTQSALAAYDNGEKLFLDIGTPDMWEQIQHNPKLMHQSTL